MPVAIDNLTPDQRSAIEETVGNYRALEGVDLIGWKLIDPDYGEPKPDTVYVEFTYMDASREGASDIPGREVTIFAKDGKVVDSQDFG